MTPEQFSPEDSLALIHSMIRRTRSRLSANRFYFLFWGWVVFGALLAQFVLKVLLRVNWHYQVWWVIVPAVLVTLLYARRHRAQDARTYVGESMGHLWMGIGICFFVLSFLVNSIPQGYKYLFPFYVMFYGLGTFISGRLLQFRPLVIGGLLNWLLAIACTFVSYDYQMVLTAVAILTSYIIPGYLLNDKDAPHEAR